MGAEATVSAVLGAQAQRASSIASGTVILQNRMVGTFSQKVS
jgi:hypothetical protein